MKASPSGRVPTPHPDDGLGFQPADLIPLWNSLGFVVLFYLMNTLDRTWGPGDLWLTLFFIPVKPVEMLFEPLRNDLLANRPAWGSDFHAYWIFGAFCYALAGSLYAATWRFARGRRSPWIWGLVALVMILLALQAAVCKSGWGEFLEPD